jgi:hypothetical protein
VRGASAGAERRGGVLCADPAYVVIPQAKTKTLWRPKRIGNWLAVHTRVHPRQMYSVRGHEGRMLVPLTIWPIRDLQ